MLSPPNHARLAAALFSVLIVATPSAGENSKRTVRAYIFEIQEEGSFRLENGFLVTWSDSTLWTRGNATWSGDLRVGMEVEAIGLLDSEAEVLQAEEIMVLTDWSGPVEGSAVIEERQNTPDGVVLATDGRRLLLTDQTQLLPPDQKSLRAVEESDALQPGLFVSYRGQWRGDGLVAVREISAWLNVLEQKEEEIYEKYEPHMLLPATARSGPAVLKIDKNRYEVFDDRGLQLYIDRLGTRLLPERVKDREQAEELGYRFWFIVAAHERPQASAFPSGVVVVHTGLFRLAENEAQLAFAIAHEIAHVTEEHAWREYQYQRRKLLFLRWSTAGLGYVVESAIRRGYQRDLEAQADRLALSYMVRAGYDPREGMKFLGRLESVQEGLSALFWDTHRSYGARRRALTGELVHFSVHGLSYASLRRDSPEYVLFRDKIPTAKIEAVR